MCRLNSNKLMLQGFNKNKEKALGYIKFLLEFMALKIEAKFT